MKSDQIKVRFKKITGKAKEVIGKLTGDKELEIEGSVQKNIGKIQVVHEDFKDAIEKKN